MISWLLSPSGGKDWIVFFIVTLSCCVVFGVWGGGRGGGGGNNVQIKPSLELHRRCASKWATSPLRHSEVQKGSIHRPALKVWEVYCKIRVVTAREYWIIYRGQDFLAVAWFGSSPTPFPLSRSIRVVSLSQSSCVLSVELTDGRRRCQIIQRRERLIHYTSFNTLWLLLCKKRRMHWRRCK